MRLSFLGGTTDYPEYFHNSSIPGRVLGTTLDKYVYVTVLNQPSFEKVKYRFSWRVTESVSDVHEISHPVLRKLLEKKNWASPLNISTMASLPGRSGMGSSSAFTVSLISVINSLEGSVKLTADELAREAIEIERFDLQEAGGWQDQYHAAIGGFRLYEFRQSGVTYTDEINPHRFQEHLSKSLVLIATGEGRDSKIHAQRTSKNIQNSQMNKYLDRLSELTKNTYDEIISSSSAASAIDALTQGMVEGWELKKKISQHQYGEVDQLLDYGFMKGARAGKLCGAGSSGFAAFIVDPERIENFIQNFPKESIIRVSISTTGQQITYI
jgi:D-glycero-alpha-D-manno-heptose-7-phosphate kinase